MANDDVLLMMKEAVRTALYEAANEEIKRLRDRFENEMTKTKREMVGKIVNQIQISANNLPSGEYVIQLRFAGGVADG